MSLLTVQTPQSTISRAESAVLQLGEVEISKAVQELCRRNFLVFQKIELGMELGKQHEEWWDRLSTKLDICEMAPRDHGKSMSLARAYPLWRAKYDPWCTDIMILGADAPSAIENLDKMKDYIAESPYLQMLVPTGHIEINSRTELKLANGVLLRAKGIGSPLRGKHPQLIVMDDVLNEKNSLTPDHRKVLETYFYQVVFPMKDKGLPEKRKKGFYSQIVIIGTAQDKSDLYHSLQKKKKFLGEKMKAVIDDTQIGEEIVLWPERYPYPDLMEIKDTVGALNFSKEYMNEPLSDETAIFPTTLFDPLKDYELSYERSYTGELPVFLGADFSVPGSQDGDWTVVFVATYNDETKEYVPLHYWRARPLTMQEQIHQIELICNLYNVTSGALEANLFQRIYAEHFKNKSSLPLVGHVVTRTGKMSSQYGLLAFRPQFENKVWRFPYKTQADRAMTDQIVLEFNGIVQRRGKIGNESYHDDVPMAMMHCLWSSKEAHFEVSWE